MQNSANKRHEWAWCERLEQKQWREKVRGQMSVVYDRGMFV